MSDKTLIHKDIIDYVEWQVLPFKKIFKSIFSVFFYFLFNLYFVIMLRIPQLVYELISFKGFILAYTYYLVKFTTFDIESLAVLGSVFGVGAIKTVKDISYYKRQDKKEEVKSKDGKVFPINEEKEDEIVN